MKRMKRVAVCFAVVMTLAGTSLTAFAATDYKSAAEAAAGVTGKTVEDVDALYDDGKSYGEIAADASKLPEFHEAVLAMKKNVLSGYVKDGILTQADADAMLQTMTDRQTACDGTGNGCWNGNCAAGTGSGCIDGHTKGCGHNTVSYSSTSTGHHGRGSGHGHGGRHH